MTPKKHAADNASDFVAEYIPKYMNGQERHGGHMWTMGAYQALTNMEQEVEDQWSYARQIRLCLDQIKEVCDKVPVGEVTADSAIAKIIHILARNKDE